MRKITENAMRNIDGGAKYYVRYCGTNVDGERAILTEAYNGSNYKYALNYYNAFSGMGYTCQLVDSRGRVYAKNY